LIPLLEECARGELIDTPSWSNLSTVGIVLASRGYPGSYETGCAIQGLGSIEKDVLVFHAGTSSDESGYVTSGGRVLTLVARGENMTVARERAYRNAARIRFDGATYRSDLALRELEAPALT
jgi:phosphoribosylamine--glycine ligase